MWSRDHQHSGVCLPLKRIVTVVEHSVIGGAVAECLREIPNTPRQIISGVPDAFQRVGDDQYLQKVNYSYRPSEMRIE